MSRFHYIVIKLLYESNLQIDPASYGQDIFHLIIILVDVSRFHYIGIKLLYESNLQIDPANYGQDIFLSKRIESLQYI